MIVNDILDPLCQTLLHDISVPNPQTTLFVHNIKIDPVERMTDALFDILQHKDADHAAVTKLIHESMEKEAAIVEETEIENNKIWLYRLLQLLKNILCDARDRHTFIELDKIYINTPFRLGKFVAGLLASKQKYLPNHMTVFKDLETIVANARIFNPRHM